MSGNTNGVLDKFRIRGIVKGMFNPGRNQSWDWNQLLTTIETEFEGNFDLATLQADIATNKGNIATNVTNITTNDTDILNNKNTLNALTAKVDLICNTITAAAGQTPPDFKTIWDKAKPCA